MIAFADQRSLRPRLTALTAAIVLATSGAAIAGVDRSASLVAVPHSWPLAYERGAQVTPLRSRIEAMRVSHPAPANHISVNLVVSNCADDGSMGSLRAAVDAAVSGDVIDMTALTCGRISLTNGALDIELDELTLRGPGATQLSIDGSFLDRVVFHPGSDTLRIENLIIEHGRYAATGTDIAFGGCIATAADLTLTNSVVRDCTVIGEGAYGGGVLSGLLTMRNSTISGNTAFGDHPVYGTAAYGGGAFSYGVDMLDSTISGNSATAAPNPLSHFEIAGGLFVAHNGGIIERSTISNNYAVRFAGGFTQEGDLTLRNSTVSGNSTRDNDGGGIRVRQITAITIENSTITNNHSGGGGGGISFINFAQPSTLQSSIVAGNSSDTGAADIDSTQTLPISGSNNLIQDSGTLLQLPPDTLVADPQLLPLANNGGRTQTHALAATSPAVDHGSNPQNLATDQRGMGFARIIGASADIGAFEYRAPTPAAPPVAVPGFADWSAMLLAGLLAAFGSTRRRAS